MSLWLNLIPQLHRPGEGDEVSMRHHHFQEPENDTYYDGSVREQTKERPPFPHIHFEQPSPTTLRTSTAATMSTPPPPKSDTALQATTTECPPNTTILIQNSKNNVNSNNLLRKLASSHYQSYTTALTITIAVGCFLLLLNILIFAGIYHQRDRGKRKQKQKEELAEAAGSCSSSSGETYDKAFQQHQLQYECSNKSPYHTLTRCDSFERKHQNYYQLNKDEIQMTELPLQEFNSSPPPAKRPEGSSFPPDVTSTSSTLHNTSASEVMNEQLNSPGIPDPPPPPKTQPPTMNQTGILRSHHGLSSTPGTAKKRVQIQEISV